MKTAQNPATAQRSPAGPLMQSRGALHTLAIVIVAILALHFGQDILIPFAVAVLLSFVLGPLISRLRRLGVPRVPSVLLVVAFAFMVIGAIGALVGSQLVSLAHNLPTYQQNIEKKIKSFQSAAPEGGLVDRTSQMLRELRAEIADEDAEGEAGAGPVEPKPPVPVVRVEEPEPSTWEMLETVAAPLLGPIGTAGLAVVLVIFMLLERENLRDRLIRLIGGDLYVTTEALDEVAQRVSRYLLMQLVVNATYGIPIGIGLYFIGVPNALLWGVLATLLRFIPYVGPVIAGIFPIALAIAVDPGWSMLFWTVALITVLELISNNVVEPWLYGSSTGISALAIIVAAIFWTMLWGPVGLFLSTPLTVCLAVVGRYMPQLRFLDILLGSAPALTDEERFYQRMLAGDSDEGADIAEHYLEEHSLSEFYDRVALPALRLAERDRQRRALAPERRAQVTENLLEVVAELADHELEAPDEAPANARAPEGGSVLCIAGRTGLDLAAATMVAQLLEQRGIGARVLPAGAISPAQIQGLNAAGADWILLSYMSAGALTQARPATRRLRRAARGPRIAVGFWNEQLPAGKGEEVPAGLNADRVFASFTQAVAAIASQAEEAAAAPIVEAPIPENEAERLAELRRLQVLDTDPEQALDLLTRRLAHAFNAPIALLTLVDEARQFWKASTGLPSEWAQAREAPRNTSICGHVVAGDRPLVIEDLRRDARFANNPFLRELGALFYAGAPVRTGAGLAVGALSVIDTMPRRITDSEAVLLEILAEEASQMLERRAAGGEVEAGRQARVATLTGAERAEDDALRG